VVDEAGAFDGVEVDAGAVVVGPELLGAVVGDGESEAALVWVACP
jgi:hypothetical protein